MQMGKLPSMVESCCLRWAMMKGKVPTLASVLDAAIEEALLWGRATWWYMLRV